MRRRTGGCILAMLQSVRSAQRAECGGSGAFDYVRGFGRLLYVGKL